MTSATSSLTTMNFVSFDHTWKIRNFKKCYQKDNEFLLKSAPFYSQSNNEIEWHLTAITNTIQDATSQVTFLAVYIESKVPADKETKIKANIVFWIVDEAGNKYAKSTVDYNFSNTWVPNAGMGRNTGIHSKTFKKGVDYFIEIQQLLDKTQNLLPNDVLTIRCELVVLPSYPNTFTIAGLMEPVQPMQLGRLLFTDTYFCDVTIVCTPSGEEFKAHKNVLAMASSVFKSMFTHDMKEKQKNQVDISDMEPEVIKEMLYFIYTGEAPNMDTMAPKLLQASDKYELNTLKETLERHLASKLTFDTAADILILADDHSANGLKREAIEFILANLDSVKKNPNWGLVLEKYPLVLVNLLFKKI